MVSNFLLTLSFLALLATAYHEMQRSRQRPSGLEHFSSQLPWGTLGLLGVSLVGFIWERGHGPPVGFDEAVVGLAGLSMLGYIWLRLRLDQAAEFLSAGLLITVILLGLGMIDAWLGSPTLGQPPLWLWGVLARWVILCGAAALVWLAALTGTSWRHELHVRRGGEGIDFYTSHNTAQLNNILHMATLLLMLIGGLLYMIRAWWGWGPLVNPGLAPLIVILLLMAAFWLRFTWPYRMWWVRSFILLAFVASSALLSFVAQ